MKKFEYKIFNTNDGTDGSRAAVEKYLCDLGGQGWEVVQVVIHEDLLAKCSIFGLAKREVAE